MRTLVVCLALAFLLPPVIKQNRRSVSSPEKEITQSTATTAETVQQGEASTEEAAATHEPRIPDGEMLLVVYMEDERIVYQFPHPPEPRTKVDRWGRDGVWKGGCELFSGQVLKVIGSKGDVVVAEVARDSRKERSRASQCAPGDITTVTENDALSWRDNFIAEEARKSKAAAQEVERKEEEQALRYKHKDVVRSVLEKNKK